MQFASMTQARVSIRLTYGEWTTWIAAASQEKRSRFETALLNEGLAFRAASNHVITFDVTAGASQDMHDNLSQRAVEAAEKAWSENGI